MELVIVLHDLRGGGAERMMVRLANALTAQNNNVTIALLTGGGVSKKELSASVELVELRASRTFTAIGRLRDYLRLRNPQTILSVLTHVNVATALAALGAGMWCRLVVSERNTFSLDKQVNRGKIMRFTYWLAPRIYRWLAHPVVAVSEGVAKDLMHTEGLRSKDLVVAPNPVLTSEIMRKMAEPARHPWLRALQQQAATSRNLLFPESAVITSAAITPAAITPAAITPATTTPATVRFEANEYLENSKIIVAVGRLCEQKGFDTLIQAFHLARQQMVSELALRLVIFGEGEQRGYLESLVQELGIQDVVDLPGYSDNPLAEMRAASLFVLSSRFEGSPNVLVEAMATGVAVIATDCPSGPREILQGGRLAPLVAVDDSAALATGMVKCLRSAAPNAELSEQARRFCDDASARAYTSILRGSVRVVAG